jgi:thiol-disulfide isomerase/thioredoxin
LSCFVFGQEPVATGAPAVATIPSFELSKAPDSSRYSEKDLSAKKRTIFIVFSPDCGHCQMFTRKLMDSIALFKKTQIVMVSSLDYSDILRFYNTYAMASCKFITVARDANYFFITHFQVQQFPSAYVFDKKGRFVKKFVSEIDIKSLAAIE